MIKIHRQITAKIHFKSTKKTGASFCKDAWSKGDSRETGEWANGEFLLCPTRVSMEVIVSSWTVRGFITYLWDLQPTYTGAIIKLLSTMDSPVWFGKKHILALPTKLNSVKTHTNMSLMSCFLEKQYAEFLLRNTAGKQS